MRVTMSLIGLGLVLAGCSPAANEGGQVRSPVAGAAGVALTPDGPLFRTAGLWETTTSASGGEAPPVTSRACLDPEIQKAWNPVAMPAGAASCAAPVTRTIPGGFAYDVVCKSEGAESSVAAEVTGDARQVAIKMTSRFAVEGGAPMTPGVILMKSRHIGPCPADMKPGDTLEADGTRGRVGE